LEKTANYRAAINNGNKAGLHTKDVSGIYLYTSELIYKKLNDFLRDDYVKDDKGKEE
jgi:hypothetical protein